jgi:hypothetical protein
MMQRPRISAHAEYRQREEQRVKDSITLAEKFPKLKSLSVELTYVDHADCARGSKMKYKPNLENARSVFRFNCSNTGCVGGDFDLSTQLATAIGARRTLATGEMRCQGWRDTNSVGTEHCHNILRYKLSLGY